MRSNATCCQYSPCLSCTLCPRSDSNETGIQSSWRKELSCRASHGMMRKMNKITERFVTGFAFSLTTSFAHKCKNTWNTELGYRGRAHTQSQRKILLNYLILGLLKVNKASLHRSCLPGTPGGITGSLHFGWSWVSKISSSISSPPRGRFLSRWCLTSTLPGEHWGWELIKSEKCLLLLSINCFLKSCWIFQWPLVPLVPEKISSFLTFSSVFSPFSFAAFSYVALSLALWSSDPFCNSIWCLHSPKPSQSSFGRLNLKDCQAETHHFPVKTVLTSSKAARAHIFQPDCKCN